MADESGAETLAASLREAGLEATATTKPSEAAKKLAETPHDLLIVDADIENPPALAFLAKVRQLLPRVSRALFEKTRNETMDARALINGAAPTAIFTGSIDPALAVKLVRERRALLAPAPQAAVAAPSEPPRLKPNLVSTARSRQLTSGTGESAAAAVFSNVDEDYSTPAEPRPKPGPAAATATPKSAVAKAVAPPPAEEKDDESPWEAPKHANTKLELDLMSDDRVGEVARVLDLMLAEPDVRLPVLPQVANEVRKLLAKEDVSFEKIADVVGLDPSMSARILEVANSPLYGGKERIRNLPHAVSRIGMRETRNILQAVSVENLFAGGQDKRLGMMMMKLWMHSLACAYSNEILAKDLSIEESGDFFMMGLLHDIGKLVIIHLLQQGYERKIWTKNTITDELLEELLQRRHNILGARILIQWEYDRAFQEVVFHHNDADSKVCRYGEAVVVTYYSNLLTRKMGFSLREYPPADPLNGHDLAQALNMSPDVRDRVEASLSETVQKIRESFR
jgi:HD-like signal output (HDOD) protein